MSSKPMWDDILNHRPKRPYQPRKRCKKHPGILLLQGSWVCPACRSEQRLLEYMERRSKQAEATTE